MEENELAEYIRKSMKGEEPRKVAMVIWAAGFKMIFEAFAALDISDDITAETFLEFANEKMDAIQLSKVRGIK